MIAEHSFVTTLEHDDAFAAAERTLDPLEFLPADEIPASGLAWTRGPKHLRGAPSFRRLPMRLRMEFDRGRVNLALSIEHARKPHPFARPFSLTLLSSLEAAITAAQPAEDAATPVQDIITQANRRDRRRRAFAWLFLLLFFGFILFLIAAAYNAMP